MSGVENMDAKHGCFVWADDLTGGQVSGVQNTDVLHGQTT